jgi:hypothetical protein
MEFPDNSDTSTHRKALNLNRDSSKYGTLAEIGAGQEVSRWFFRVGGASRTIAKSMSAYDMQFSDAIYGHSPKYVSRLRLITMLDHEYDLLKERLDTLRGATTKFFAYANTIRIKSYKGNDIGNGWMGLRFQTHPQGEPNDVILHVWMHDKSNSKQQEAIGILGVNLIDACLQITPTTNPSLFLDSLMHNLSTDDIEIDMIVTSGQDLKHIDNQKINLSLVAKDFTSSVIFSPSRQVHQASEVLYRQPVLIGRGRFRPFTKINAELMEAGLKRFALDIDAESDPIELMEMSIHNLLDDKTFVADDYLARIELINHIGKTVMVSNRSAFHKLAKHVRRNTPKPIGIVLGVPLLKEIFDERYYEDLEGGLLEGVGRLFKRDIRLYVYPVRDQLTGKVISLQSFHLPGSQEHLLRHLIESKCIVEIPVEDNQVYGVSSLDVSAMIQAGDERWKMYVDQRLVTIIEEKNFFFTES